MRRGSQTLAVSATGDSACRVAAVRLPYGRGWSFAIVNESDAPCVAALVMPARKPMTLHEYRYFVADRPVEEHGFPIPSTVHKNVNLAAGQKVQLPNRGVIFLTTHNPADLSAPGR